MPFAKGKSGNPGGRPKGYVEFQMRAREFSEAALKTLVKALNDERHCVAAATALLDRGWGKPPQSLSGEGGEGQAEMLIRWLTVSEK